MLRSIFTSFSAQLLTVVGCSLTAACGAAGSGASEQGTTSEQQEGLGEASCATTFADVSETGGLLSFTSPTTYTHSDCYKAYIAQVENDFAQDAILLFGWGGPALNDQASCTSAVIYAQEYSNQDHEGTFTVTGPKEQSNGVWSSGRCQAPALAYAPFGPVDFTWYRYAVSARSGGAGGPTQSFYAANSFVR